MPPQPPAGIGKGRIEALADGVFAIAMTLLILNVNVPVLKGEDERLTLPSKLVELWPKFLAFVVSFLILGVNWVGHHAQLHYIRRTDRLFLWMNLLFLLVISAMPFATALLSEYHDQPIAVVIYCGSLITAGLILYGQLRYAAGPGQLFDAEIDWSLIQTGGRRILMGPALYTVALGTAFWNTGVGLTVCAVVPLLYIVPGRVDRLWRNNRRS
jgi:uncharacterized membrane protein